MTIATVADPREGAYASIADMRTHDVETTFEQVPP